MCTNYCYTECLLFRDHSVYMPLNLFQYNIQTHYNSIVPFLDNSDILSIIYYIIDKPPHGIVFLGYTHKCEYFDL